MAFTSHNYQEVLWHMITRKVFFGEIEPMGFYVIYDLLYITYIAY